MKAVITGENDQLVGVNLRDNNGAEHVIEMEKDGSITAHQQDGYPDDSSQRSMIDEVEPINQARRFAKYVVYRERGYETLGLREHPDRIAAAALTVAALGTDTVEELFGELYLQSASHYADVERPVALPEGATPAAVSYQQDLHVAFDDAALDAVATLLADADADTETAAALDVLGTRTVSGDVAAGAVETLVSAVDGLPESLASAPASLVEAVSGIHVRWHDAAGQYHTQWGDRPDTGREPDARIDLQPYDPESLGEFHVQLVRLLFCQVRDCYLGMGIAPPEPFRILGHGMKTFASWYEHYDFYDRYHDPDATVGTWYVEHTPGAAYGPGPVGED